MMIVELFHFHDWEKLGKDSEAEYAVALKKKCLENCQFKVFREVALRAPRKNIHKKLLATNCNGICWKTGGTVPENDTRIIRVRLLCQRTLSVIQSLCTLTSADHFIRIAWYEGKVAIEYCSISEHYGCRCND